MIVLFTPLLLPAGIAFWVIVAILMGLTQK